MKDLTLSEQFIHFQVRQLFNLNGCWVEIRHIHTAKMMHDIVHLYLMIYIIIYVSHSGRRLTQAFRLRSFPTHFDFNFVPLPLAPVI